MTDKSVQIIGARTHNLKNINVELPRDQVVVITGLSGSGKSSLAFDTLYAEGQRQYVESLSIFSRQFFNQIPKADVDQVTGLQPTLCLDQSHHSSNRRSTVGTITEIYDYLRLLFARIGIPHCTNCGRKISSQSIESITDSVIKDFGQKKILFLGDIVGSSGCNALKKNLPDIVNKKKIDFVVVNGENGCKYQGTRGEIILTIGCIIVRLLLPFFYFIWMFVFDNFSFRIS